jgi:hypothetical protein
VKLIDRHIRMRHSPSWWVVGGIMLLLTLADLLNIGNFNREIAWMGLLLATCTVVEWIAERQSEQGRSSG